MTQFRDENADAFLIPKRHRKIEKLPPKYEAAETPIAVIKTHPKLGTSPKINEPLLVRWGRRFGIAGEMCCGALG